MAYSVKECFLTLQGEGVQSGSRAVFLRFAGCNLWSGREQDRATAQCNFCDTDFVGTDGEGGGKFADAESLADHVAAIWGDADRRLVVITGGEPMLQLDAALIDALHAQGFRVAVESNGTLPAVEGIDWLCVSPKAGTDVVQRAGDELKLVWPQQGIDPATLEGWDFRNFLIQPMDCEDREASDGRVHQAGDGAPALAPFAADPQADRIALSPFTVLGRSPSPSELGEDRRKKRGCRRTGSLLILRHSVKSAVELHRVGRVGVHSGVRVHSVRVGRVHGHIGVHVHVHVRRVDRSRVVHDEVVNREVVNVHRVVCGFVAAASRNRQGRTGDQDKSTHSKLP